MKILGISAVSTLALALAACTGSAADVDNASQGIAEVNPAPGATRTVTGDTAERLIAALEAFDAVDHALGGRMSVDISNVACTNVSNAALAPSDPLFMVPIMTCTLDVDDASPSHRELVDPPATAKIIFDAIADASESFVDSAVGGHSYVWLDRLACEGDGPGAGSETPAGPTVVTCSLAGDGGEVVRLEGAKAMRVTQGFDLASLLDHALGGRFGIAATELRCDRSSNLALDASSPSFGIPSHKCSLVVSGMDPSDVMIEDGSADALKLQKALLATGLVEDSAMGQSITEAARISCSKGPGAPATCTITSAE